MKVYIATGLKNWQAHNELRDLLAQNDIGLTYDWTEHGSVKAEGLERIRSVSEAEMDGVRGADVVIAMLPGGRGTHCELGGACILNKNVILYDPSGTALSDDFCVFYHYRTVLYMTGPIPLIIPVLKGLKKG